MRLVDLQDGKLELRWTWLPYWMAAGPALQGEVNALLRDAVVINGMLPDEDGLDRIHNFALFLLTRRFPSFSGLKAYLRGIQEVEQH
jgi:hypothetical protein